MELMKLSFYSSSDRSILRAVRRGDSAGWERFCNKYNPVISSVLTWPRWNFTEHEQQDVRQNIYLQLHKALPSFRGDSSLRWFVAKIAHNQCVDEIRRQVRQRLFTTPFIQKTPDGDWNEREFECPRTLDPCHEVLRDEERQALQLEMDRLQETCRDAIKLYYIEDMSYQAMSEQLGIAVNTVGSRLSKCLDKLHKELQKYSIFERKNP